MYNAYNNNNGGGGGYDHYGQQPHQTAAYYNRPPSDAYNNRFSVSPASSDGLDSGQFFSARENPHGSHDNMGHHQQQQQQQQHQHPQQQLYPNNSQRSSTGFYMNQHPESAATAYDADAGLLKSENTEKSPAKRQRRR
ncbi:hypothetical protein GGI22_007422, partial [Coemansia erecta]